MIPLIRPLSPPSPSQILALQDTSDSGPMSDADRRLAAVTEEALSRCCFEDIFTDSKFLKQGEESDPEAGGGGLQTREGAAWLDSDRIGQI